MVPRIEEVHHGVFRIFGLETRVDLRFRQPDDRLSQNDTNQVPRRCLGENGLSVLLLLPGCFRREVLGVEGEKTGREAAQVLQLGPVGRFPVRTGSVEQDLTYREHSRPGLLEHSAVSSMFGDEFGNVDMFPEKSRSRMKGPRNSSSPGSWVRMSLALRYSHVWPQRTERRPRTIDPISEDRNVEMEMEDRELNITIQG